MSTTATTAAAAAHTLTRRNFPAETSILTTGGDVYFRGEGELGPNYISYCASTRTQRVERNPLLHA
jgi:hypothetical protein